MGSAAGYRGVAAAISAACGHPVVVPDYRLAPESPFPAAVEDAQAVMGWAAESFDGRWVLAGDSAGGGLTMASLMRARDQKTSAPAGAVLMSPWRTSPHRGEFRRPRGHRQGDLTSFGAVIGDGGSAGSRSPRSAGVAGVRAIRWTSGNPHPGQRPRGAPRRRQDAARRDGARRVAVDTLGVLRCLPCLDDVHDVHAARTARGGEIGEFVRKVLK